MARQHFLIDGEFVDDPENGIDHFLQAGTFVSESAAAGGGGTNPKGPMNGIMLSGPLRRVVMAPHERGIA